MKFSLNKLWYIPRPLKTELLQRAFHDVSKASISWISSEAFIQHTPAPCNAPQKNKRLHKWTLGARREAIHLGNQSGHSWKRCFRLVSLRSWGTWRSLSEHEPVILAVLYRHKDTDGTLKQKSQRCFNVHMLEGNTTILVNLSAHEPFLANTSYLADWDIFKKSTGEQASCASRVKKKRSLG